MNATEAEVDTKALLPCPLCGMHLRAAVDPRLSGMLEHPPHAHCPVSAVAFLDRADLRAAWNRRPALSTLQMQSAQGWKLVPIEPTQEMRAAAQGKDGYMSIYRAMIDAAPTAPDLREALDRDALARALWLAAAHRPDKEAHWDTPGLMLDIDREAYFKLADAAIATISGAQQ